MNIVFMGTPDFAAESLKALISNKYNVKAVFCQPDKKSGRGMKLSQCAVKQTAIENNIEVFQPDNLRNEESAELLKKLNPDIIIVVAYGKILPQEILDIPELGCVNIHGSLLPKYRGAAPIQHAVLNGDKVTGITSMFMDRGLDTGDIILKEEIEISEDETSEGLFDKMMVLGGKVLIKTLKLFETGNVSREKQNDAVSSYAPMLSKEMGHIDYEKSAAKVHNLIRGLYSWPCAYSLLNGKRFKILCSKIEYNITGKPGEIIFADKSKGLVIACGDGNGISVQRLQFDGKKPMNVSDYFVGNKIETGIILK